MTDAGLKIAEVTAITFDYETTLGHDPAGHAHPGPPRRASQTILRVRTEGGAEGYGVGVDPRIVEDIIAPAALGADALAREKVWRDLSQRQRGPRARLRDADLAAFDVALWDLAGRLTGLPVYRLLGSFRDRVPAYASTMCGDATPGGLSTPEEYADFAEQCRERGYPAFKLHTWMPPVAEPSVDRDIAACRAVRDRVGADMELMVDPFHYYDRLEAKRLGQAVQELGFTWIEEPMRETSMSSYKWLADQLDIPLLGPETAPGQLQVRAEWVAAGASDALRAGVRDIGGITPMMKAVHLAEAFGMPLEVHSSGLENLQILGAMPINGRYYERGLLHPHYDYDTPAPWLAEPLDPLDPDGFVTLPDRPGVGWVFDWDYIERHRT